MIPRVTLYVALAALALSGCKRTKVEGELPPPSGSGVLPPDVPKVQSLVTERLDDAGPAASNALSGTGTLYAREEAALGPKASGVLSQISVKEGDHVKKGQMLFRLESSQASLGVQQAKSLLESAEIGLHAAELDYKRTKELYDRGSVAAATFDQVKARYDNAKAQVSQARVSVSMAQKVSGDTVVKSPIDGVVTAKHKSVGETVTMMPPTIVLVVQDITSLELRVRLPERSLKSLTPGSRLRVQFPSVGLEREVPVKRVQSQIDVGTRSVEVIADLDNQDQKLKPGMLAEVSVVSGDDPGADAPKPHAAKKKAP